MEINDGGHYEFNIPKEIQCIKEIEGDSRKQLHNEIHANNRNLVMELLAEYWKAALQGQKESPNIVW